MISLRNHDRVGRTVARPDPMSMIPSIEQRAAIARSWSKPASSPQGIRREMRRPEQRRSLGVVRDDAISAVVDPVIEALSLEGGKDIADLQAFARRLLER